MKRPRWIQDLVGEESGDPLCPPDQIDFFGRDRANAHLNQRKPGLNNTRHDTGMAIRIAFVRVAQIAMRVDLDHAHIRMAFGVRADRPERAGMLPGERDHEPAALDMGA